MAEGERGLILTHLDIVVDGKSIQLFDGTGIAFQAEAEMGDAISDQLEHIDHIEQLNAMVDVWVEGEVVETLEFSREDIDSDEFWATYYEALREAYKGVSGHAH